MKNKLNRGTVNKIDHKESKLPSNLIAKNDSDIPRTISELENELSKMNPKDRLAFLKLFIETESNRKKGLKDV